MSKTIFLLALSFVALIGTAFLFVKQTKNSDFLLKKHETHDHRGFSYWLPEDDSTCIPKCATENGVPCGVH